MMIGRVPGAFLTIAMVTLGVFALGTVYSGSPQEAKRSEAERSEAERSDEKATPPRARPAPGFRGVPEDKTRRDFSGDCLSSGCHARLNKTPWVHSPVAVGACDACHTAEGAKNDHKFRPTRPKEKSCSFCHQPAAKEKFQHKPFSDGECGGCHDPHGGATPAMLLPYETQKLCGTCHAPHEPGEKGEPSAGSEPSTGSGQPAARDFKVRFAFPHKPFSEQKCLDCHKAHQSDHEKLMILPEKELCLSCHPEVAERIGTAAHLHKPLEAGCRSCHASHGAENHAILKEKPRELCLSCHEPVAEAIAKDSGVHGALETEAACTACHTSHEGSSKELVVEPLSDACYSCHDRELTLPSGRKISNVKAEIAGLRFKHGPVATGDCRACHLSHSSPHAQLLTKEYPRELYADFAEASFDLCFSCHDKRIVTEERSTITWFRDGDRNLHHLHVNRKKGRTCTFCHTTHGSDQPGMMREKVPFGPGGWQLPIAFEKTAKGGTCASGCHQQLHYDNSQPRGVEKAHLLPAPAPGSTPREETEKE